MINSIKEILVDIDNQNVLDEFCKAKDNFINSCDTDLNNMVLEDESGFRIKKEQKEEFDDLLKWLQELIKNSDKEKLLTILQKDKSQNVFWKNVVEYIENNNQLHVELDYLRRCDIDFFSRICTEFFNNCILLNGVFKEKEYNKEEITALNRLFMLADRHIVNNNESIELAKGNLEFKTGLSNEKLDFIYELYNYNKDRLLIYDLQNKINNVDSKMTEINNKINELITKFSELIEK